MLPGQLLRTRQHARVNREEPWICGPSRNYIRLLSGFSPCALVLDSSYVARVCGDLSSGIGVSGFQRSANWDMIQLLQEAWYSAMSATKVKSNVLSSQQRDSPHLWHHLGNDAADGACRSAVEADMPIVQELAAEIAEFQERQLDQLQAAFAYYVDLEAVLQRMQPNAASQASMATHEATENGLLCFPTAIHQAWIEKRGRKWKGTALQPPPDWVFSQCKWGHAFAEKAWHWSQTLEWTEGPSTAGEGTTTLELLCNFVCVMREVPPIALQTDAGGWTYIHAREMEAKMFPAALRYWLHVTTCILQYLERSTKTVLLLGKPRKKVACLQRMCGGMCGGMSIPVQARVRRLP